MAVGEITMADLDRLLGLVEEIARFRIEEDKRLELHGAGAVWRELTKLRIEDGWLTLTDRVLTFTTPGEVQKHERTPLEGELRLDGRTSVHLRHFGEESWRLTWLRRVDDPRGCGTRRAFFAAGTDRELRLGYEVDWRLADDVFGQPVLRPFRSRFAGFEKPEG